MEWENLPIKQRHQFIRSAVINGLKDRDSIVEAYNTYAKGGYENWKQQLGAFLDVEHDNTYDYEGYYNDNPITAWQQLDRLRRNQDSHFPDTFKTAYHPTFSDESRYSGIKDPRFNPNGIIGGHWYDDYNYQLSNSQFENDWDISKMYDYLQKAGDDKVRTLAPDGSILLNEVVVTPRSSALNKARQATKPNTDFTYAQDMSWVQGQRATYLPRLGAIPHTCLNTVTGFYDENNTVASNANFVADPRKYGYKEINQTDAKPGDIIILSNGEGHPVHAVMFDNVSQGRGQHNRYPIEVGDTLVNYSNGGREDRDYRLQGPLPRFDNPAFSGGDFSGPRRYFRYTGKKKDK